MSRWLVGTINALGWLVFVGAILAPMIGLWLATQQLAPVSGEMTSPAPWRLAWHSLLLATTCALTGLLAGLPAAAVLSTCAPHRRNLLIGLLLAPLLVPPQVYAYAWGLVIPAGLASSELAAIRAGLISAGWLWPLVSLIVAAGWRSSGAAVYHLAILDTTPGRAFIRAVLPVLRPQILLAVLLLGVITLIEYAIPHLVLSRVWSTELMVLVEVGAGPRAVVRMAAQVTAVVLVLAFLAAWLVRETKTWLALSYEDSTPGPPARLNHVGTLVALRRSSRVMAPAWGLSLAVWLVSVAVPIVVMLLNLRVAGAWKQAFTLFAEQWVTSVGVSAAVGLLVILLAVGTMGLWQVSRRWWAGLAGGLVVLVAIVPPPALGVGYILAFNRAGWLGWLYSDTPIVWILSLVGRYAAVAVLITWLALGRRGMDAMEQARVDGAGAWDVQMHVWLPAVAPALLAAGLLVALLSLCEVVVTQMTCPPAYRSISMTILNYMHYGRDDAVIASSITLMVVGVIVTQVVARLTAGGRA